jgi:hypothetical protein
MRKGNQTSFKKGIVNNPKGRPKGSISPLRKQLLGLRNRASDDFLEVYDELREKMKSGEAWAFQIFFKELASMPKEWLNEIDTTNIHKEIKSFKDIQQSLINLFDTLINSDSLSQKEAIDLIKSLKNTEINDSLFVVEKTLTFEEKEARQKDIKAFTQWKKELEKHDESIKLVS